jgi:hypothetical protein
VALVCVYRRRNASSVRALIAGAPAGTHIALWALDEAVPDLEALTVGTGPGGRLHLVNRLADAVPVTDVLVISDDDISFVVGDIGRLVAAGSAVGFDVFQPAHSALSRTAFRFTRKRLLLFARETTFVEQGPLVVLDRRAREQLLPFPGDFGMGWGIEVRWSRTAAEQQLRLGIVDAVAIRHSQAARTYDDGPERVQMQRELDAAGLDTVTDLHRNLLRIGVLAARRRPRRSPAT